MRRLLALALLLLLAPTAAACAACMERPTVCAGDFSTGPGPRCDMDTWDTAGVGLFRCQNPDEGAYWIRIGDLFTSKCAVPHLP